MDKLSYALHGLTGRLAQKAGCPSCRSQYNREIDRKYFHQLLECSECNLLFRYPREAESAMRRFYQRSYRQTGLTTDLPDDGALAQLLASNFAGTSKDFDRFAPLFAALRVPADAKLLDFGANWGYGMHQFQKMGLVVSGYEISEPRAAFGRKLGLTIATDWETAIAASPFDVIFSAHVIEHTPDPAEVIRRQISVVRPGGYLIAVFPHGSAAYREVDAKGFHHLWGQVHPVLPTVEFVASVLPTQSWFFGALCENDVQSISVWDGKTPTFGDTSQSELLVVYHA